MTPTPPDQPEDAALLKAVDDLVFRCFQQGVYWGSDLNPENIPEQPIDRTEANKQLLQLFHEHEHQAMQAVRIDEVQKAINPPAEYDIFKEDNCEHDVYLPNRLDELETTQPPAVIRDATKNSAADTTKQGEGE